MNYNNFGAGATIGNMTVKVEGYDIQRVTVTRKPAAAPAPKQETSINDWITKLKAQGM